MKESVWFVCCQQDQVITQGSTFDKSQVIFVALLVTMRVALQRQGLGVTFPAISGDDNQIWATGSLCCQYGRIALDGESPYRVALLGP